MKNISNLFAQQYNATLLSHENERKKQKQKIIIKLIKKMTKNIAIVL